MKEIYAGAVIAAGGTAQRMLGQNKQTMKVAGVPVLARSILAMAAVEQIKEIVVVSRPESFEEILSWKEQYHLPNFILTSGGESRQQSVKNGIEKLSDKVEYYVIHDGARPFANKELVLRCLQNAVKYRAATAAVPVKDTVKKASEEGFIAQTPERKYLYLAQTPQIFESKLYRQALQKAQEEGKDVSDDCQLVEAMGCPVFLSMGDYRNIKITTPEDREVAEVFAAEMDKKEEREKARMEIRTGHGYDVHKLVEGRKLILGGVEIPWEKGLLGHSDADVLLHAVMDSLLGAAALGDIGKHFPDNDPAFLDADSRKLLQHVVEIIEKEGYSISNIDCTVIAQKPKLKDYISRMCQNIADTCHINVNQVNVKATTEEKLGFTGSGEGMSAHSVCILTR